MPWLGWTCGTCKFCRSGRENLCDRARFTGYDIDGGFAELTVADERFCFALPDTYTDVAPPRCSARGSSARARSGSPATRTPLGLYGFGAAAHIITQVARASGS